MVGRKKLEDHFHEEMIGTYVEAKRKCNYNATRFLRTLNELGGVETERRLLTTGSLAQSGLTKLWKCKRLDISVEAKVLIPRYKELFGEEIREIARDRLAEHGFDVVAWTTKLATGRGRKIRR